MQSLKRHRSVIVEVHHRAIPPVDGDEARVLVTRDNESLFLGLSGLGVDVGMVKRTQQHPVGRGVGEGVTDAA